MARETCGTCRFWDQYGGDDPEVRTGLGRCRVKSPTAVATTNSIGARQSTIWPQTFDHDWCGEWQGEGMID